MCVVHCTWEIILLIFILELLILVRRNKRSQSVGMTSRGVEGFQFGQRRPPLSDTIKSILHSYPDGQIFKASSYD